MTTKQTLIILWILTFLLSILLGMKIGQTKIVRAQEPQKNQCLQVMTPYRPTPTPEPQIAKITAYTCDPTMTAEQKAMNCPNGITATGTVPQHMKTVACPVKYLGTQFEIEGVGIVTCEDVGGAIKGEARFDLFLDTYSEAMQWGTRYLEYKEV